MDEDVEVDYEEDEQGTRQLLQRIFACVSRGLLPLPVVLETASREEAWAEKKRRRRFRGPTSTESTFGNRQNDTNPF